MCCSRVCRAMRYAWCPRASTDMPMIRPGACRTNDSRVAKKAACGPPYPSGTPKRWELPTTASAPISPGGVRSVSASRSLATATSAPAAWALSMVVRRSSTSPRSSGYCRSMPNARPSNAAGMAATSPISSLIFSGSARPRSTSIVCGKQRSDTMNTLSSPDGAFRACSRWNIVIASAAAVASSSRDAVAISIPVRSRTTV